MRQQELQTNLVTDEESIRRKYVIYNVGWSQFFSNSDIKAGREYACAGKVLDVKQDAKSIKATVKGSENYKVAFAIHNTNEINKMSCSCPAFESKRYCKHCSAVLWKLDPLSEEECVQNNLLNQSGSIKCTLPKSASPKEKLEDIVRQLKSKYKNEKIYSLGIIERENSEFKSSTINAWSRAATGLSLSEYLLSIGVLSPMVNFEMTEDDVDLSDIQGKRCCSVSVSGGSDIWIDELLKKLGAKVVFPTDSDIDYAVIRNFNITKEPVDNNRHAFWLMSLKETGNAKFGLLGDNFISKARNYVESMEIEQASENNSNKEQLPRTSTPISHTSAASLSMNNRDIQSEILNKNTRNDFEKCKYTCDTLRDMLIKELCSEDYTYPETDGSFSVSGIFIKELNFDILSDICKHYFSTESTNYDGNWGAGDLCRFLEKELNKYHKGERYSISISFGGLPPAVVILSFLEFCSKITALEVRFTHNKWESRGDITYKEHVGILLRNGGFEVGTFGNNEHGVAERWDYVPDNFTVVGQPLRLLSYKETQEESDVLVLPRAIYILQKEVFKGCKFKNIYFDTHIYDIESGVFSDCAFLESINWPNTVYIREDMFKNCINLTSITIPDGVYGIEKGAFVGCKNLEKINIPSTVAFIEDGAFEGCDKLLANNPKIWNLISSIDKSKEKFLEHIESYKQYIINNGYASFEDKYYGFKYIIDTKNACESWHNLYDSSFDKINTLCPGDFKYCILAKADKITEITTKYNTQLKNLGWIKTKIPSSTTKFLFVDTKDIPNFTTFVAKQNCLDKGDIQGAEKFTTTFEKAIRLKEEGSKISIVALDDFCKSLEFGTFYKEENSVNIISNFGEGSKDIEATTSKEAEHRAREEADRKAREEAERKAREEAERLAREEAERKAREEAERKAREEAERLAREEADRKAREEAERKAREDAERLAREEAERKARKEAERKAREEAECKAREEAERKAREEAERLAREEAERKAREEAERKAREEAERKAREDAERKAREEAECKAREEAERKTREEAERKAREEAERLEQERIRAERRAKKLCQHCGGTFKGLFAKKCRKCGMKKDY